MLRDFISRNSHLAGWMAWCVLLIKKCNILDIKKEVHFYYSPVKGIIIVMMMVVVIVVIWCSKYSIVTVSYSKNRRIVEVYFVV